MQFEETKTLELKEKYTKSYLKTVSAFATYETGRIIFGVKDSGEIVGIEDIDNCKLKIENAINTSIQPLPHFLIEVLEIEKKKIVQLTVFKGSSSPYYYKHRVYRRADTSTVHVDSNELEELILQGKNMSFVDLPSKQKNLSFNYLESALKKVRDEDFHLDNNTLKTLHLIHDGSYNRAAEIFSDQPENNYASVDIVRFGDSISIFLERKEINNCCLIQQFEEALDFFDKWYKPYEEIVGFHREKRIQIPREAYREAIANALIHQDFSISASVQIAMHEDKIIITSAGGLPKGMDKKTYLTGGLSVRRNPSIANVFKELQIIERFGTGVPRIIKEYGRYHQKPEFNISENRVQITLPKIIYETTKETVQKEYRLENSEIAILQSIHRNPEITLREIEKITGISRKTVGKKINQMEKNKILEKLGSPQNRSYRILIEINDITPK
ncbi:MAG: MarR family transcriptional regulator [Erysipelothrix sp.]|nr:MarR family transcriptional regulator [Erysipelothrix sp.]